jgi:branched-chain amino acid transport system ATP-binding protein
VNQVSFSLEEGDLFGLIGPNGAGKTTCFNLITGMYKPTSGQVLFRGDVISGETQGTKPPYREAYRTGRTHIGLKTHFSLSSNRIAELGICRTFQNIRLFQSMSVVENIVVGGFLRHRTKLMSSVAYLPGAIKETQELTEQAMKLLDVVELRDVANVRSADLPYGSQRRLEIARAMATQPKLLLLDEPAAGMNPQEKMDLMNVVRKIRDEHGMTVLLIEHDMRFVMGLCEKIFVLDHGEEIAYGPPQSVRNDPKVIAAYLGEAV